MNRLKWSVVVLELEQVACDLESCVWSWVKAMCGLSFFHRGRGVVVNCDCPKAMCALAVVV